MPSDLLTESDLFTLRQQGRVRAGGPNAEEVHIFSPSGIDLGTLFDAPSAGTRTVSVKRPYYEETFQDSEGNVRVSRHFPGDQILADAETGRMAAYEPAPNVSLITTEQVPNLRFTLNPALSIRPWDTANARTGGAGRSGKSAGSFLGIGELSKPLAFLDKLFSEAPFVPLLPLVPALSGFASAQAAGTLGVTSGAPVAAGESLVGPATGTVQAAGVQSSGVVTAAAAGPGGPAVTAVATAGGPFVAVNPFDALIDYARNLPLPSLDQAAGQAVKLYMANERKKQLGKDLADLNALSAALDALPATQPYGVLPSYPRGAPYQWRGRGGPSYASAASDPVYWIIGLLAGALVLTAALVRR